MADEGPFGPIVNGTTIIVFYEYRPNQPAAYAFMALFAIATIAHIIYLVWLRAWSFIPFILGGIAEAFGYYGRAQSHDDPRSLGPWILQNLLILAAAPLLSATLYMSLGRVILALDARRHALVGTRWITKLYILLDIVCLGSQLAGTVMPASGDPSTIELSRKIVLIGLIIQLAALSFFYIMAWCAHRRIQRDPPKLSFIKSVRWQHHFWAIRLVTILIFVRSLIRMIEYAQGESGFILEHEIFIYLFDAALMWIAMAVFLIIHPTRLTREARFSKVDDDGLILGGMER